MTATVTPLSPADMRTLREQLGVSRQLLVKITGLPLSRVWAAEQDAKDVTAEHRTTLTDALLEIQTNGLPEGSVKRTNGNGPAARLRSVAVLLEEALAAKSLKDTRALVEQAMVVAAGQVEQAGAAPEPSAA